MAFSLAKREVFLQESADFILLKSFLVLVFSEILGFLFVCKLNFCVSLVNFELPQRPYLVIDPSSFYLCSGFKPLILSESA